MINIISLVAGGVGFVFAWIFTLVVTLKYGQVFVKQYQHHRLVERQTLVRLVLLSSLVVFEVCDFVEYICLCIGYTLDSPVFIIAGLAQVFILTAQCLTTVDRFKAFLEVSYTRRVVLYCLSGCFVRVGCCYCF